MATDTRMTNKVVSAIHNALVTFGYPVEFAEVRATTDRLTDGQPAGSDIIAMFIRGMLEEAGVLDADNRPVSK